MIIFGRNEGKEKEKEEVKEEEEYREEHILCNSNFERYRLVDSDLHFG